MNACADHRLQPDSSCAKTCLSRVACPIAPEHRYSDDQLAYHYSRSLETIREWQKGEGLRLRRLMGEARP
jgi:hypothetical protein